MEDVRACAWLETRLSSLLAQLVAHLDLLHRTGTEPVLLSYLAKFVAILLLYLDPLRVAWKTDGDEGGRVRRRMAQRQGPWA